MTVSELLPSVASLSHAEKFRLVQIVLRQLAEEEGIVDLPADEFDPRRYFGLARHAPETQTTPPKRSLRGCLKPYARPELMDQEQEAWPAAAGEKHEPR